MVARSWKETSSPTKLPAGADAYVVKSVIDDWDDDRTVALLKNCRRAIAPEGRLVVIAPVLPETVERSESVHAVVMFDLEMLVAVGAVSVRRRSSRRCSRPRALT
jgi:hypothetical protein